MPGLNFVGPEEQANIDKIEKAIKVLRGEAPPEAPAKTGVVAPPPGRYVYDPATKMMKPLQ